MPSIPIRATAGFLAGALAVVIFHQGMYFAMKQFGLQLPGTPWNMAPAASAFGIPTLFNQMFWGGLWGIVFALVSAGIPGRQDWLKGFVFGMIGPMLLGSWLIVAAVKGQPILSGVLIDGNPLRLRNGFLLNGVAFGIGLGLLHPQLSRLIANRR